MKANMGNKYKQMKDTIQAQNNADFKKIREQRQNCLEEKYANMNRTT